MMRGDCATPPCCLPCCLLRPAVPAVPAVLPSPAAEDIQALQSLLEATSNALIASHILHLMCHCFTRVDPPDMTPEQMQREWVAGVVGEWGFGPRRAACGHLQLHVCADVCLPAPRQRWPCISLSLCCGGVPFDAPPFPPARPLPFPAPPAVCADRLVREIAAHKHHLQDAAQYALGTLMAQVLGDVALTPVQREGLVGRLLEELQRSAAPGQCQGGCCRRAGLPRCCF